MKLHLDGLRAEVLDEALEQYIKSCEAQLEEEPYMGYTPIKDEDDAEADDLERQRLESQMAVAKTMLAEVRDWLYQPLCPEGKRTEEACDCVLHQLARVK
jgi:hypothetical protein